MPTFLQVAEGTYTDEAETLFFASLDDEICRRHLEPARRIHGLAGRHYIVDQWDGAVAGAYLLARIEECEATAHLRSGIYVFPNLRVGDALKLAPTRGHYFNPAV